MSNLTLSALPIKEAKYYTEIGRERTSKKGETFYLQKDAEKFFSNYKFPKDWKLSRNKYRLYIPISSNSTYEKVKNELPGSFKLSYDDYVNNQAIEVIETQRGKKERPIKLGKLLNQLGKDELVKEVASDKARESKANNRYVVISRHPYDIAGMTSDREWEGSSCMSIPTKKIEYGRKYKADIYIDVSKSEDDTIFKLVRNDKIDMPIRSLAEANRIKFDRKSINNRISDFGMVIEKLIEYLRNGEEEDVGRPILYKMLIQSLDYTINKINSLPDHDEHLFYLYNSNKSYDELCKEIAALSKIFNSGTMSNNFKTDVPDDWGGFFSYIRNITKRPFDLIYLLKDISRHLFYGLERVDNYKNKLIVFSIYDYEPIEFMNAHDVATYVQNMLEFLVGANDTELEFRILKQRAEVITNYGFRVLAYSLRKHLIKPPRDLFENYRNALIYKTASIINIDVQDVEEHNHVGLYHKKVEDSCRLSLIAYEINGDDLNIRRPIGRKLINTYYNNKTGSVKGDYILVPAERSYGNFSDDANVKVKEFCKLFNKDKVYFTELFPKARTYNYHQDLYNDRNKDAVLYEPLGDSMSKETNQIFEEIKQAYYSKKNKKGEVFDLIKLIQIKNRLSKARNDQKAIELMNLLTEFIDNLNSKNTNHNLIKGFNTFVSTPKQDYKGYFALTELDYLQTSNLPEQDFRPNPNYPADCQTRQYYANKNENDVIQAILHKFKPQHVINDSPDAITGTPVISESGIVLGGNKRSMILKSLRYEQYETYLSLLKQKIYCFGITEKEIYNLKKPVLVRVIEDFDITKCSEISYQLNKDNSVKYSPLQEGISASRTLKENKYASDKLLAIIEEHDFETIAELFDNNKAVKGIIGILTEIGIFNDVNKAMYISDSGLLTGAGEDFVQFMFLGTVIKDKVVLENAKNFANKIIKTLHLIFKISEFPAKYNINQHIQFAMKMEAERKLNNMSISQVGILKKLFEDDEIPPEAVYLYLLLNSTTANQYLWKEFLLYYTKRVDYLIQQSQAGNVFGNESEQDLEPLDIIKEFNKKQETEIDKFIGAKSERQRAFTAIKGRFGLSDKTNISQVDKYQERIERGIRFLLANEYNNLGVYFNNKRVVVADLDQQRPIAIIDLRWDEDAKRVKANAQIGIVDINGNTFTKAEEMIAREIAREIEFITKIAHKKAKSFIRSERLFNSEQEVIDLTKTKEFKKTNLDMTPLFDETQNELNTLGFERIIPGSHFEYENNELLVFHKSKLLAKINLQYFVITYKSDLYNKEIKQIREILKARTNESLKNNYKSLQQLGNYENNNFILLDDLNNAVFKAIPQNFSMLIWGSAGGGKSTLALNLLKDLGSYGKALYFTSEEKFANATITKKLELIGAEGENIWFEDTNDVGRLIQAAQSRQFKFIVVDSVNMLQLKDNELIDLIKNNTGTNFILISHSTKDKRSHKGDSMLEFYPDIVVKVVNGIAELTKNRFAKAGTEPIKIFDYFNKEV